MARMHQSAEGRACPGCEEPVESGDRFCGACGYDLSALPAPSPDRPTLPIGTPVEWPAADGTDTSGMSPPTQRPGDLPGTDSAGDDLPLTPPAVPGGPPADSPPAPGNTPAGPAPVPASSGPVHAPAATPGDEPAHAASLRADGQPAAAGTTASDTGPGPAAAHAPYPPAGQAEPAGGRQPAAGAAAAAGTPLPAGAEPAGPVHAPAATPGGEPARVSAPAPGGRPLPPEAGGAVRHDTPPTGDFELAAPVPGTATAVDPRAARPQVPAGGRMCVACRAGHVDPDGYCENCGHAQPRERDHMEQELGSVAAVSDRGLRHHRNEDSFAVSSTALPDGSPAVVAFVCDGVSSATRPDEASAAAARAANERLLDALPRGTHPQQAMHEAIVAASEAVNSLAGEGGAGEDHGRHQNAPACTIVGAVSAAGLLVVGWVGDSRAYWVPDDRGGPPARLTEDDSWAAQMVAAGLMNEAEAYADERAHAITGWLGADAYELEPHTAAFKPDRPGVVVVCTDGLWNYAEGAEDMARAVPADAALRPLHSARALVGHALDSGGHDNVTVAVLPFAVPPPEEGAAQEAAVRGPVAGGA
ncbi:protein phosphatase 2C domain-containing protein [Streptomyces sp. NPDC005805]|uniref:PP2C family serine/threonine-protein phosphatase n=1 Tax=Streptomyces sp. NPDC005805 TaxID=3157068 RepID=UPI0033E4B7D1